MSNSSLASYTRLVDNCDKRRYPITKITIHHMAGNLSLKTCGNVFVDRGSSANYAIDSDGNVGMYVPENYRSYCSSNADNDHRAITIEVANNGGASKNWSVSSKALAKLIDLCVDICERNGIEKLNFTGNAKGNLTQHNYFTATACPGPYLKSKFPYIAEEVNKRLGAKEPAKEEAKPNTLYRVQIGAYSVKENAEKMAEKLEADGFNTYIVEVDNLYKVQIGAYGVKENAEKMAAKAKAEGYNTYIPDVETKAEVVKKKTIEELAREVIDGKWGNGRARFNALEKAGYDSDAVQDRVNEILD